MPIVTSTEMFKKAYEGGYAIGACNVNNMETIQGIVEACTEENAPVILQVSAGARKYANPVYLRHLIEAASEVSGLPIVMHLDHGDSFELCKSCVDGGFTSVMIDASHHSFEENIKGCIKTGFLADFVVLDKKIEDCSVSHISDIKVLETYVGGKRVF